MYELDFAARTDRGLVRETNQDVVLVAPPLGLALVADGMGGHEHGALASSTVAAVLEQSFGALGGRGSDIDQTALRLRSAIHQANERLAARQSGAQGRGRMGTTLVAAVFAHGQAVIGNVGDSRCYRLREKRLDPLTRDHSYGAQLDAPGEVTTHEDKEVVSRWAHVLTRCLNGDEGVAADLTIDRCQPGDVYLLCSDGLWGAVAEEEIAAGLAAAEDANDACDTLIGAAWAGGGLDNIGVAVVRLVPPRV